MKSVIVFTISHFLILFRPLTAQTHPDSLAWWGIGGDWNALITAQDSLEVHLLDIDIQRVKAILGENDLWHRLIPNVSVGASFALKDVLFLDPATNVPYVLPRDSYRLSLSLSLSDLLSSEKQVQAEFQLARLETERARLLHRQHHARMLLRQKILAVDQELSLVRDEVLLTEDVLRYKQLMFDQGKIHYDAMVRSRMDLLDRKRSLIRLNQLLAGLPVPALEFREGEAPE